MTAKVFISSTGKDLAAYRQVAREVCEELGLVAIGMESFEAMGAGATQGSKRKLDDGDVYVGIFAHRYGYVEPGYDKSVTECEYDYAGSLGLEQICFLHDSDHAWPPAYYDADGQRALEAFKARINASHIRALFTTEEDFRHKLYRALESWKERKAPGIIVKASLLHQLPPPPADFTGREETVREVLAAIEGDGVRGVTICGVRGMGGVGKTSLALVAANLLAPRYPDAQIVVDLRGTDPDLTSTEAAMAQVVQAFQPQIPPPDDPAALAAAYRTALHGKRALLVFDNAASAAQVQPLLPPANCLCLVTSRRRFPLPGQRSVDLDALPEDAARELLEKLVPGIDRAVAGRIVALCGRLPLALRLAGGALAQRPDLTATEYAQRLEDAPERLRLTDGTVSVEDSLALSWNLLGEGDRADLARLAVFPTGFDRRAAAAALDRPEREADKTLGRLLVACLVEWDREAERYRLHDLVRDFVAARLGEGEERAAVEERHAEHFATVILQAKDWYEAGGEGVLRGLRLFDRERQNVETGFGWARAHAGTSKSAVRLCNDYLFNAGYILHLRLHSRERISWLEAALAAARSLGNREAEARHLENLGLCYWDLGDPRLAIELHEHCLAIERETGNRLRQGETLGNLAHNYATLGETRKAIEFYEQHLTIAKEFGDRRGEVSSLGGLGTAYKNLGETDRAIDYYEQQLTIAREIGDRQGEANALVGLGLASLGEPRRAIEHLEESLAIAREIGARLEEGTALANLGTAYWDLGDPRRASEFYEQYLAIAREIGDRRGEAIASWNLGAVYNAEGDPARAVELMSVLVEFEREIGHASAETHGEEVDSIRRRLP